MALSTEEEESIEAIKKWWHESGKSLVIGLAAAAAVFFGWQFWQSSGKSASAEASAVFEQLTAIAAQAPDVMLTDADRNAAGALVQTLKTEHGDTVYALYGALFAAKLAVDTNDLDIAENELRWLLANTRTGFFNPTDESLILTAQLRLGRVLFAKGEAQQALDLIAGIEPLSYAADFAELRGDLHLLLGNAAEARSSWQEAAQLDPSSPTVQMKLNNLTVGS